MPKMMKNDLHTETPTVSMSIFKVVCFPVMVKNLNITTIKPMKYDKSFWKTIHVIRETCIVPYYPIFYITLNMQ